MHGANRNYDGSIPAYASSIPELRRLHNSRMVYTKHPVWYIPYGAFTIYLTEKGRVLCGIFPWIYYLCKERRILP
ncbi:MAG: hypothetical protein LBV64_05815 [Mediterranea sp.]|nr:hypothetical protein [Mediterranea sp.]